MNVFDCNVRPCFAKRSSALQAGRLAILLSLLPLFAACSTSPPQPARPPLLQVPAPPPSLLVPCAQGLLVPDGDLPLSTVVELVSSKVYALGECSQRHDRLSDWVRSLITK